MLLKIIRGKYYDKYSRYLESREYFIEHFTTLIPTVYHLYRPSRLKLRYSEKLLNFSIDPFDQGITF